MFWVGLGMFRVRTYPPKGSVTAELRTGVGGGHENETPSGQNETHLGNMYLKWAKVL